MYAIHDKLFIQQKLSEKEYQLSCAQGTFLVPDAQVLVYWKQQLHRIRTSQIGDGMEIVLHVPVATHAPLSIRALEAGLSVYHEYDEEHNERAAYLYKYGGGDYGRQRIQELLRAEGSMGEVVVERGFTRLGGFCVHDLETFAQLANASFSEQVAFFVGLCIGYGKPKQLGDDRMLSWHVGLPIVGSVASVYEYIEAICARLGEEGIYLVRSVQMQRIGSYMQCTIHDAELLDMLETIRTGKKPPRPRYAHIREKVVALLGGGDERLENSVLKFISK